MNNENFDDMDNGRTKAQAQLEEEVREWDLVPVTEWKTVAFVKQCNCRSCQSYFHLLGPES